MADNTSNSALQSILPTIMNPNSGLTDNHAKILQGLIDKAIKGHAEDFLNQVGPEVAQQVVNSHTATSPTNQDSTDNSSNAKSILDPLIAAAQQGQTQVSAQKIDSPQGPSNVQRGNFEFDKPANMFEQIFGRPQVFQDANGNTHYKPGGFFGAAANESGLMQAQALQKSSGTESVQPVNSIAYQTEQAIQQAQKVPMTQAQKAEYDLSVQQKGIELAKGQVEQFNSSAKPTLDILGKIDTLTPLAQAAMNGDKTAQGQYIAGLKELSGASQTGNILNQSLLEKGLTGLSGQVGKDLIKKSLNNIQTIREAQLRKLAGLQNNTSNQIGNLKIGDKVINPQQLLNHPYVREVSQITNNFKTEADAKKAGLPDGTPITINGVKGTWSN